MNNILKQQIPSDNNQYAYTKHVGTTDALVKMTANVASALDNKENFAVQALYLDFSKAFDLMRPDILIEKMIAANVDTPTIKVFLSFLTDRSQSIKFMGHRSQSLQIKTGVPQGTISGPILWNIYVADLQPAENTIKYADDTTLYSSVDRKYIEVVSKGSRDRTITIVPNAIQEAANQAVSWCEINHQSINAAKTQHMFFTLQLNPKLLDPITIKGQAIEQTKLAKLLGVHLDCHLTFAEHVRISINKTRTAVHGLLMLKRHGVRPDYLVKYYRTCILPILAYAAPSWYTFTSQSTKDTLEKHQSLCLRVIYPDVESYTERLSLAKISRLNDHLSNLCSRYIANIRINPTHRLTALLPTRQSVHRHSSRLPDTPIVPRTSLQRRSLFYFSN